METKVAVVTGGGSGIGRAICDRLHAEGFRLGVLDVDGPAAASAARDGLAAATDVSDPGSVSSAFDEITRTLGPVDVLVNNAGITGSPSATRLHETPLEDWDRVMAVNLRGLYLCSQAVLPSMIERHTGHIITIASVAGIVPFPGRAAYSASKGAALLLAKSIAVDYAADGIRSNAVCPGMVETPMTQWRLDQPELRAAVEDRIPLGTVAQPADIADAVSILASDRLSYMTGHALVLDGGWTAK
jgi:NAD(P)-dependent dehydrogenase (short-subunit alcohol dehydrogenase family)